MGDGDFNYPIHLALAYLFMAGYLIRTLFVTMKLPGVVGVLLSGFLFGHFIQVEILESRDHLQQLAFFLVLLTAGFEISINDLKPYMIVLALLPCTLELVGITVYASYCFGWSWIEAAVLGTSLFALGDGLVIPKMAEFGFEYPALQVPRLVFTAAPLECSFALTLFGVLKGLAEPADQKEPQAVWIIILANVVRILATLAFGAAVGTASGYFLSHRTELTVPAVKVPVKFTGQPVEAFLLILAVALAAFGLGCEEEGVTMMWPMGFSPGPMLQPELLVIVIGSFFARAADAHVLHGIEGAMSGVWVFGQLILFSMLGSRTELKVFEKFWEVCPLLLVGLSCRLVGYRICKNPACKKCKARNEAKFWYDVAFIFVASLPRATIQGALGSIPMTERFFASSPGRKQVQLFIAASAKIYIVLMSVVGSILLDVVGRWSLDKISALPIKCEVLLSFA
ncbi:unnamed protein product [Polarella glacialis]|uniref:Cation/H+ exchanger domain-containing protein n=1 Tax=Polarella glacialis TaxID=89957 RepID=A0A813JV81_POLGL|nr:unnamed protein product [Polarella glacialis]